MSVQVFGRCSIALLLASLIAGCSVVDLGSSARGGECGRNRSNCMYEGPYEQGERAYAEQEARRLNQASYEKLRRSAVR